MNGQPPRPDDAPRVGALELPEGTSAATVTLLRAAAGPADEAELSGESAAVAEFVRHVEATGAGPTRTRSLAAGIPRQVGERQPLAGLSRSAVRKVRAFAVATVVTLVLGGGLAAADALPAPAQRWVSRALDTVGIDVPSPGAPDSGASVVPSMSPAGAAQDAGVPPADRPAGAPGAGASGVESAQQSGSPSPTQTSGSSGSGAGISGGGQAGPSSGSGSTTGSGASGPGRSGSAPSGSNGNSSNSNGSNGNGKSNANGSSSRSSSNGNSSDASHAVGSSPAAANRPTGAGKPSTPPAPAHGGTP